MDRKFANIQTNLKKTHSFHEASPTLTRQPSFPVTKPHPSISKVVEQHKRDASPAPSVDSEQDPDTDEEDMADGELIRFSERELVVLRRSMRKWWRLAGLKGTPRCADEMGEEELSVDWTRAIAPRVEGRIKDVTPKAA
jgi:5'-nucleotidase